MVHAGSGGGEASAGRERSVKGFVATEKPGAGVVHGSLNPSFASFDAPGQVVLQAGDPRITPRIATVETEVELRPPQETFYHPDAGKNPKP